MEERVWDQTHVLVQVDLRESTVGMVKDFYLFYPRLTKGVVTTLSRFVFLCRPKNQKRR